MTNTEKYLSRLNAILALNDLNAARPDLESLAAMLADKVRAECAASRGETNATRVISQLLRGVRKNMAKRTMLHYAWNDELGRQCVCDGNIAFRLKTPLPVEERPADAGKTIDLNQIIPNVNRGGYRRIPMPTAADVKAHIALERAKKIKTPVWDFGEGLPLVNASYLLDLITILPDATEIYCPGVFGPLYAISERGEAVLMPIRTDEKLAQDAAAENAAPTGEDRQMLREMLDDYRLARERDPKYSLTPDQFAEMAKYVA